MRRLAALTLLTLAPSIAAAEDFYVDPERGSPDGDGSAARPWRTLQEVIEANLVETRHWSTLPYADGATLEPVNAGAPIGPGDTIWLASGYHGELAITGAYNESPITIAALDGETPQLRRALFRSASNWVLRGVSLSPSFAATYEPVTIVDVDDHGYSGPSHDIVIERNTIFSVLDISGWSAADWVANACNGIAADGEGTRILDNTLTNVRFGISVSGANARVIGNSVRNFSGDGLRGLGDHGLFERNYVANAYDVDDNHDDGFQSWSIGPGGVGTGEVVGVVLRGNVIINYEDPAQPMRSTLQGIGCFDGTFVDWVVENNVIVTDHWHGITLLGARGSRIVNNTVLDPNGERPGPPWISIADHKDGTPSTGCVVRNNLVTALANEGDGVIEDHNVIIDDPSALFVSPAEPWDLHLRDDATAAIDVGSAELAPATDLDRIARPQGAGFDVGAYEWHEPGVEPVTDAGPGRPDAGLPPGVDGGPRPDGGPSTMDAGPGGTVDGGCGCRAAGARSGPAWMLLAAIAVLRRRSR